MDGPFTRLVNDFPPMLFDGKTDICLDAFRYVDDGTVEINIPSNVDTVSIWIPLAVLKAFIEAVEKYVPKA